MDLFTSLVICALFAVFILKIMVRHGERNSLPGPKFSFPFLGHLPFLGAEPWVTFTQWKKLYGPMFAIKMGIYDVIVLNESKLIKEAYSRSELSGRPPFELFKSATEGKGLIFSDGPLVDEQRNFAHKNLRGFGFRTNLLEESIHVELNQVLENIDKKCGRPVAANGMFAIPVINGIWSIFMGQRFEADDPNLRRIADGVRKYGGILLELKISEKFMFYYSMTTDEGPLADLSLFIPAISKLMPELSGRNKKLQDFLNVYAFVKQTFDEPLPITRTPGDPKNFKEAFIDEMERVGENLASSFHPTRKLPCGIFHGATNCMQYYIADNFFKYSTADILMAAMDTTSATLDWLLLRMTKYPEVQKRVQAEIDEEIGTTRQPALSDKNNTPYVEAVVQELLRFSSITPLAFFHRAKEDTVLRGYNIRKDTLISANMYGVHYDEDIWGDPENFRPERFIDQSGRVDRNLMRTILPFSTGKRSCIGEDLARDQIYLYCTSIFQRFDVFSDDNIPLETTVGFVRAPKDFKLTFTKRFIE